MKFMQTIEDGQDAGKMATDQTNGSDKEVWNVLSKRENECMKRAAYVMRITSGGPELSGLPS